MSDNLFEKALPTDAELVMARSKHWLENHKGQYATAWYGCCNLAERAFITRKAFEVIAADIQGCTYVSGGPGPLFEAGWNACLEMLARRYVLPHQEEER